jgi:hypothetical protein
MRPTFITAAASVAALLAVAGHAQAQANRTFVSGFGSDANPCSLAAPCRSFAQALTLTNAGGEITVLDPAGYGTVVINKAVSIVNDGVGEAGVTMASAVDAITVSAGSNDVVNLRGLTLVGAGIGNNGVKFTSGFKLRIQNSVIRGFTGNGIASVTSGGSQTGTLSVSDTIVSDNQLNGILIQPSGSQAESEVSLVRVQSIGNGFNGFFFQGASATGTLSAIASDSIASENGLQGFDVRSPANQLALTVTLVNCKASRNLSTGVDTVGPNAKMFLSQTTITGNANGFSADPGTMKSFGNNYIVDTANFGSLTLIAPQ